MMNSGKQNFDRVACKEVGAPSNSAINQSEIEKVQECSEWEEVIDFSIPEPSHLSNSGDFQTTENGNRIQDKSI